MVLLSSKKQETEKREKTRVRKRDTKREIYIYTMREKYTYIINYTCAGLGKKTQ